MKKLAIITLIAIAFSSAASDRVSILSAATSNAHPADRQVVSTHRINVQERDAALMTLYRVMKVTHVTEKDRRQMLKAGEAATAQATDTASCAVAARIAANALTADNPMLDSTATINFFDWSCRTRLSREAL